MSDLSGRRVLVTGAGQGIGAATAKAALQAGASVAVNDIDQGRAGDVARDLDSLGLVAPVAGDVSTRCSFFRIRPLPAKAIARSTACSSSRTLPGQ